MALYVGGQYDCEEARLSTLLMVSERWLQLAEMGLELSRLLCRGEMEKSCWGWEGTALGLLRILITWRGGGGGKRMLETWKIEDQSIDRVEGKYFFFCKYSAIPALHGKDANRNTPFQL